MTRECRVFEGIFMIESSTEGSSPFLCVNSPLGFSILCHEHLMLLLCNKFQTRSNFGKFPALASNFLSVGLSGLALAGIVSVMMSTADSYLLVSVQTVVSDIGKTLKPDMESKKVLLWSRIMTVILALGALVIALYMKSAYGILTMIYNFYAAAAGIPALAALYWKKATAPGMIAANIGGFAVCAVWKFLGNPLGIGGTLPGAVVCALLLVLTYEKYPSVEA